MIDSSTPIQNASTGINKKKSWWRSLQIKIVAWSFVPTVIILSAAAWFTFYSYQKVLGDLAIKQDWAVLQSRTQPLYQAFFDITNPFIVKIILQVDTQKGAPLEVRAQNIIDHVEDIDIFDGGIYFVDPQGKVVKSHPEQPELQGQDWSDTPQFRFMVNHPGKAAYSDLRFIETSGKKIVCVSASMNGTQGEFVGADYYCFTVYPPSSNLYSESFRNAYIKNNLGSNIYIIDGNQSIIYSTDPSQMGRDLSGEAYLQQLLLGESMSGRFQKGEEDVLVSYAPYYPYSGTIVRWNILKEENWVEIMRPTIPYRMLLIALLALGVLVPVFVTAYAIRQITGPIQKLIHASEQVTAGKFKQQIEVKTGDEIETLADQFNLMSAELDESYSSLEKKVTDRTRELAIMNSIIAVANQSLDLKETLADALSKTVEQMGFEAGTAFKFGPEPGVPVLVAHRGFEPAVPVDLVNRYSATGQGTPAYPKEVTALGVEDFQDENLRDRISKFGFQLLVYIPLSTKGRELGFFILGKHEPGKLSSEELALLSSIGKQIGVAMENAHLYEQAEQTAITAERSRLARELHDAVTQTLFSANLIADVIPRIWRRSPEEGMQNLEELRQLTRGALAEMRTLLLEMRPESLERPDLKSLLTQLADAFIGRVRVPIDLHIQGNCELTHEVKIVFYRVAQEALNNIAKHSGARHVELRLECQPGHLNLSIEDDGLGFDVGSIPPNHMGIAIMRERAVSIGARLLVESQVGWGTKVELDWKPAGKEEGNG